MTAAIRSSRNGSNGPGGASPGRTAGPETAATTTPDTAGPLEGLRVLDLSRILAGPTATQLLGDLVPLRARTITLPAAHWLAAMTDAGVPGGPINALDGIFAHPQTVHRGMRIEMPHPHAASGTVALIGNPLKISEARVTYRRAPPVRGEHTHEVLREMLGMTQEERARLTRSAVIE